MESGVELSSRRKTIRMRQWDRSCNGCGKYRRMWVFNRFSSRLISVSPFLWYGRSVNGVYYRRHFTEHWKKTKRELSSGFVCFTMRSYHKENTVGDWRAPKCNKFSLRVSGICLFVPLLFVFSLPSPVHDRLYNTGSVFTLRIVISTLYQCNCRNTRQDIDWSWDCNREFCVTASDGRLHSYNGNGTANGRRNAGTHNSGYDCLLEWFPLNYCYYSSAELFNDSLKPIFAGYLISLVRAWICIVIFLCAPTFFQILDVAPATHLVCDWNMIRQGLAFPHMSGKNVETNGSRLSQWRPIEADFSTILLYCSHSWKG